MLKTEEMVSLNTEMSEFDVKELEQRLETDPLAVSGLFNITSDAEVNSEDWAFGITLVENTIN